MGGRVIDINSDKSLNFKVKIQYKNGASETIYPTKQLNVNPLTPMFMDFPIGEGKIHSVNMTEIKSWDLEVSKSLVVT